MTLLRPTGQSPDSWRKLVAIPVIIVFNFMEALIF